jgi:molybdopterin converting factor small subunit
VRIAIIPRFTELRIIVNPSGELTKSPPSAIMPWMYAPWPDAKRKGVIEMEVEGETLRALVTQVANQYKQANVNFDPVDPITNDIDLDYEVLLNDKNYEGLTYGLDTKPKDGDEVNVKMAWRWDG